VTGRPRRVSFAVAATLAAVLSCIVPGGLPGSRGMGVPVAGAQRAPAIPAGNRIPIPGVDGQWYLHGVNVPWYQWGCDFGCGANGGVSATAVRQALLPGFEQARASGLHIIRWWVFPGDPWQIRRDGEGSPAGLDNAIFADFDAALQLAEEHDLYYDFVLFSSPTSVPRTWLTDERQRSRLAASLATLFARYRGNPRVLAWEVFNEPEFDIWSGKIAQTPVQATVKAIADAVHASSTAYVTVGSAMLDGLPLWRGQGLDFFQAHWYDYMNGGDWCARCTDYAAVRRRYELDAPLVIGELYTGRDADALQRFEDFYTKGYAGAWPWSLFPDRTNDKLGVDHAAAQTFAGRHAGDIGPRSAEGAAIQVPDLEPAAVAATLPKQSSSTGAAR
jgi:hypothetical protein